MIFMIDTDVVRDGVATTVLHWAQPDLIAQGDNLVLVGNSSSVLLNVDPNSPFNPTAASTKRQAPPLPPGAPQDPNNIRPGGFGARAQAVYFAPSPPPGPPHRYVMTLFAQPANFQFPACFQNIVAPVSDPGAVQGRVGFDLRQFLQAAGISGRPIAGNYLRAQNPQRGDLAVNAMATSLRVNNCPAATPAPPQLGKMRIRKIL